jgi:hypothetical protein
VKYLLLLTDAPDAPEVEDGIDGGDPAVDAGVMTDWVAYTRALSEAGLLVGGAALPARLGARDCARR